MKARAALDLYLAAVRATPEYQSASTLTVNEARAAITAEIDRVLAETEFVPGGSFDLDMPSARPSGERIGGHHAPGPNHKPGSGRPLRETYVFVLDSLQHDRAYQGFGVQYSIHPNGSGYLWLGECNNSAAHTPADSVEAWALYEARRSVPLDDTPYRGPWYTGRTSAS